MGYDIDRFTGTINEGLLCCICRDVLEDAVQAPCEHAFCSSCIQAWLVQESTCPEDRQILMISELQPLQRYMRNDLDRLVIRCINQPNGCEYSCILEQLRSHEINCQYTSVTCPHVGCQVKSSRIELPYHISNCPYRIPSYPKKNNISESASGHANSTASSSSSSSSESILRDLRKNQADFRHNLESLRSEFEAKFDEQRQEMDLRLDAQRRHLVQRETALQCQVDELRSNNKELSDSIKTLLHLERQHRLEVEKMQVEKRELLSLLKEVYDEYKRQNHSPQSNEKHLKSLDVETKVTDL